MPSQEEAVPVENLSLEGFEAYINHLFGDIDFEPTNKIAAQYVDLVPGDHIAVKFQVAKQVSPWHHGIFVGKTFKGREYNENMVVDNSKASKTLNITPLKKFGGESLIFRIDYEHDDMNKDIRCRRAYRKAAWALENLEKFEYDLLQNNCEHFATWCCTNHSRQVLIDLLPHYKTLYYDNKRVALLHTFADQSKWSKSIHG